MPSHQVAEIRHAAHYTGVLRQAETLYLRGNDNIAGGLTLVKDAWSDIELTQKWLIECSDTDEIAADLCLIYPDIAANCLLLLQHPRDRIPYQTVALAAARRL